ncbi:chitin synthase-domain-containing protein, partial [Lipomyces oligophaga]|uniref:chitin synthase-domain-containing protein n=1 Tax=Lipomyces oligophaga TaxID=45792 RepID=UPI0034CD14DF
MAVTIPLPEDFRGKLPSAVSNSFSLFSTIAFSILLAVPWCLCLLHLVRQEFFKKKKLREPLTEETAPKVVVIMPCYHEIPSVLMKAIDSACEANYPKSCLHLYVSFDGADIDDLYLSTLTSLGIPVPLPEYPVSIDLTYRGVRITVSRFVHGGKRHCQKKSFRLVDKMYSEYLLEHDDLFILFIDSDIILDKNCVVNFVTEMELVGRERAKSGKSAPPMLAMTGIITCTSEKRTFLTVLQDIEYVHGQLFERTVESQCGSVTCLPGALTMLRFSAFRNVAKYYFSDDAELAEDMFDFGKCHLGEDRWLTHLFMLGARQQFQIQICTTALCKTEAVLTFQTLLKQRRRWFLGFITNEVCMLTDIRLWKMYPLLCVVRLMQNTIRTTALLLFVLVLSVACTTITIQQLPYIFICVVLGANWGLMIIFGIRLHRYKAWLYPVMWVVNPFFNWVYMVYGIFTAGQRTWGGPRADQGGDEEMNDFNSDAVFDPVKISSNFDKESTSSSLDSLQAYETVQQARISLMPDDSILGRFAS